MLCQQVLLEASAAAPSAARSRAVSRGVRCSLRPLHGAPVKREARLPRSEPARWQIRSQADDDMKPLSKGVLDRSNPDLVEKYAVIGSGSAECNSCQYVYEPANGDMNYPIAKGVRFENLPDDWRCPVCSADKKTFVNRGKVVAGFASNQKYGMGTNSMTEGQKSGLIYGSLFFFFALFIAGYLLE